MEDQVTVPEPLTRRERDILRALAQGLNNAEIAERLVLSPGTVKWYVKQLYSKLGVHTREEAAAQALSRGLIVSLSPGQASGSRADEGCRLINPLPQDVAGRYVGNAEKLALLASLLQQRTRLISIYGRAGAGKTALACQALSDLRAVPEAESPLRPDGIVCLSAVSTGIDLARLFSDVGRLVPAPDGAALEAISRNTDLAPATKVGLLLEKIADMRVVLLLDNLETLQDPDTGALLDPGLQQFIEMSLAQSSALTLMITSREPLLLPRALKTWEHLISLEDGLPPEDAEALLRKFDPVGVTGLRDAPAEELRALAEQVGGFPRALEAAAGLLLEDPLLRLADVKRDLATLEGEVCAAVVEQALARLNDDALRTLEALALFGQPVSYEALGYVLRPYLPETVLRTLLGRLIQACFVKADREMQRFALHPLDQAYCYNRIPAGSMDDGNGDRDGGRDGETEPPAFTKAVLHRRAAAYFHDRRAPRSSWRRLEDLEPQLTEFKHLVSAGAVDEAARVLLEIDRDYLWEWDHKDLLRQLYQTLGAQDPVHNPKLAHQVARRRAWLMFFDPSQEADRVFAALLDEARRMGSVQEEAAALDDLAQTYRRRGHDLPKAAELHRQALTLYRRIGDRRGEADALGGVGSALAAIDPQEAVAYLQAAAAVQRELGNASGLCHALWMLGLAYEALGTLDLALETMEEAARLARESGSVEALSRAHGGLAACYVATGDSARGLAYIEEAIALTQEMVGVPMTPTLLYFVGFTAVRLALAGDPGAGIELLQRSIRDMSALLPQVMLLGNFWLSLTLLLAGDIVEARRLLPAEPEQLIARAGDTTYWVGALLIKAGEAEAATRFLTALLQSSSESRLYPRPRWPMSALVLAHAGLALLTQDAASAATAAELAGLAAQMHNLQTDVLRALISLLSVEPGGEILSPVRASLAPA